MKECFQNIPLSINKTSNNNLLLISFLKNKAIERQFHTYFDWNVTNCNRFFALFGDEFKKKVCKILDEDMDLEDSAKNFMEIGKTRNILVHQNFSTLSLEKDAEEYFKCYKKSFKFIAFLKDNLQ